MTSRSADLTLARVHLRLGSLALARAELETLAGRDELDDAGLIDLAEARWRTGDVAGAGEVAAAVLGDGEDGPLITLVVAAEAALARGRPTEARRYSTKAMERAGGGIDDVFAGMPRGPVWPADATTLHLPPPTLFDVPAVAIAAAPGTTTVGSHAEDETAAAPGATASITDPGPPEPNTIAIWDTAQTDETPDPAVSEPAPLGPAPVVPAPAIDVDAGSDAFLAGAEALDRGDIGGASMQLALALRLSPPLAPEILEAIEGRADRELAFVRGDAYRLVGREADARRAYAEAVNPGDATHLPPDPERLDPEPPDHPAQGDPA